MLEKVTVLTAFYVLAIASDVHRLKTSSRLGKWSYMLILLCSLYFSTDYILDVQWPDLNWLAEYLLYRPSQEIVESLRVKHI